MSWRMRTRLRFVERSPNRLQHTLRGRQFRPLWAGPSPAYGAGGARSPGIFLVFFRLEERSALARARRLRCSIFRDGSAGLRPKSRGGARVCGCARFSSRTRRGGGSSRARCSKSTSTTSGTRSGGWGFLARRAGRRYARHLRFKCSARTSATRPLDPSSPERLRLSPPGSASDYRRRNRRRAGSFAEGSNSSTRRVAPRSSWPFESDSRSLRRRSIPSSCRGGAVFILHELDGIPIPEVASTFGIPLATAYSRLRLARADFAQAAQRPRGRRRWRSGTIWSESCDRPRRSSGGAGEGTRALGRGTRRSRSRRSR